MDLADIDPVFFEKTYYAIPQSSEAARPYVLLRRDARGRPRRDRAIRLADQAPTRRDPTDAGRAAVETLFVGDEVRDPAALVPGLGGARVDEREFALATRLIEML